MTLDIREGAWHLVVATEHEPASFVASGRLSDSETAPRLSLTGASARSVVELRAVTGGLRPRALLDGEFVPKPEKEIAFEVDHSGALGLGVPATCPSFIGGSALVAGLPLEFAQAALDGLLRVRCTELLPAGVLRVNRAGHDEVDSSQMVFERIGGLLRCVLAAAAGGNEPDEGELRQLVIRGD